MTKTLTCTRCQKIKPSDGFKMCEKCRGQMRGQYYRLRQEKEQALYTWMRDLKITMSCHDCGASPSDPRHLHWDHRPDEVKIANVSDMIRKHASREVVLIEIQKCDLVCPSCHSKRGVARGQIPTGPQGRSICRFCHIEFRHHRRGHRRKFCSRNCASRSRRRLQIVHWKPPKPLKPAPKPKWWEQTEIIEDHSFRR